MSKKIAGVVAFALIAVLGIILALIHFVGTPVTQEKKLVGVIMPGDVTEPGWNSVHFNGIKSACDSLNVEIDLVEHIPDRDSVALDSSVNAMAAKGIRIIILGSYNYAVSGEKVILAHPDIFFYCCSAEITQKNFKTYFSRMYQGRYLSGILAGLMTKSNRIGYVAAMNNIEVNRGINAFTLGVRRVNPKANVYVMWTNAWDDADTETAHANLLIDSAHVDLLTYHQNQENVPNVAESRGVLYVGYNDTRLKGSDLHLTTVFTDWSMVYHEFIQDFWQKKQKDNMTYWTGIEKDAVGLSFFSRIVPDSAKNVINEAVAEIKNGSDVFVGEIKDNTGKRRCEKNEAISDTELRSNMNWFVEGVVVYEK